MGLGGVALALSREEPVADLVEDVDGTVERRRAPPRADRVRTARRHGWPAAAQSRPASRGRGSRPRRGRRPASPPRGDRPGRRRPPGSSRHGPGSSRGRSSSRVSSSSRSISRSTARPRGSPPGAVRGRRGRASAPGRCASRRPPRRERPARAGLRDHGRARRELAALGDHLRPLVASSCPQRQQSREPGPLVAAARQRSARRGSRWRSSSTRSRSLPTACARRVPASSPPTRAWSSWSRSASSSSWTGVTTGFPRRDPGRGRPGSEISPLLTCSTRRPRGAWRRTVRACRHRPPTRSSTGP